MKTLNEVIYLALILNVTVEKKIEVQKKVSCRKQ